MYTNFTKPANIFGHWRKMLNLIFFNLCKFIRDSHWHLELDEGPYKNFELSRESKLGSKDAFKF